MRRGLVRFALFGIALGATACQTTTDTTGNSIVLTAISLDPSSFLGSVPCSDAEGAMQSYVATLFDLDAPDPPFVLPSSGPIACSQAVTFRYVVPGHAYTAEIDGYELGADSLVPAGGDNSGSRHMQLQKGHDAVSPRWQGACATDPLAPVRAVADSQISISQCRELVDLGGPPPPKIVVDPSVALGAYSCAADAGTVATFDVLSASFPSVLGVACGGDPVAFTEGIEPGVEYDFRLEARDEGGAVIAASACSAIASPVVASSASCDPLSGYGAMQIDPSSLPSPAGLLCTASVDKGAPGGFEGGSFPCDQGARIAPLSKGTHHAEITARDSLGTQKFKVTCTAAIVPALTTKSICM